MVKGTVGIVVKNPAQKQPSTKIVARKGRIEAVEEEGEAEPNGTEFVIATRDSPELDSAALAVGRVVDGMDVVEKIAGVSAVKDNAGSPYFRDGYPEPEFERIHVVLRQHCCSGRPVFSLQQAFATVKGFDGSGREWTIVGG